jgi:hypothetical protein
LTFCDLELVHTAILFVPGNGFEKCSISSCPAFKALPGVQMSETEPFECRNEPNHGECQTPVGFITTTASARSASAAANASLAAVTAAVGYSKILESDISNFSKDAQAMIASAEVDALVSASEVREIRENAATISRAFDIANIDVIILENKLQSISFDAESAAEDLVTAINAEARVTSFQAVLKTAQASPSSNDLRESMITIFTNLINEEKSTIVDKAHKAGEAAQAARAKGKDVRRLRRTLEERHARASAKMAECYATYNAARASG